MDPQACYARWLAAVEDGATDEARDAKADLCEWFAKGGAKPQWTTAERAAFFAWAPGKRPRLVVTYVRACDACGGFCEEDEFICRKCKPHVREGRTS